MEEIKLLKEMGLDEHLQIAGYVLLFSFIVKTLYQNHIQQFLSDIRRMLSQITRTVSDSFKPSLYEMLPNRAKKTIDVIEAIWSYIVSLASIGYFVLLILISKNIVWEDFSLVRGIIYSGLLIMFISLSLASLANGNKAVQRFRNMS